MLCKLNETKNVLKNSRDVLERGVGVEVKRHYILP